MKGRGRLLVVSDLHRAGPGERQRRGFDERVVRGRMARVLSRWYRRHVWLADPMAHNHLLGEILRREAGSAWVVANGDFTLDTAFVGVSDDAALESAAEALAELRSMPGAAVRGVLGDHDLGKKSLVGDAGGPRWRSLERCESELGLPRLWHEDFPGWRWVGVTSTLLAWPVFRPEAPAGEWDRWDRAHREHLGAVEALFSEAAADGRRLVLFCHDPTALPFLGRLEGVRRALPLLETTVIGHLHSPWVLRVGQSLSGMPRIGWAGHTVRRYSTALGQARWWRTFRVTLCPSPTGIQCRRDGGYLVGDWPPASGGLTWDRRPLEWDAGPGDRAMD